MDAGMKDVTGFSLLSVNSMKVGQKRRHKDSFTDVQSMNDSLYKKRRKF